MKKLSINLLFLLIAISAIGQVKQDTTRINLTASDTIWKINVLQAPSSPGASLLGISPTVIQKPTDPTAFSASLLSASNNLSAVPNSYAVDLAPAWLFGGQHITYKQFNSNSFKNNVWQSLVISLAEKKVKDSLTMATNTSIAVGVKISFLRGTINQKAQKTVDIMREITSDQEKLIADEQRKVRAIKGYKDFSNDRKSTLIDSATAVANKKFQATGGADTAKVKKQIESIKAIGEQIDFSRYGWKLDLAGGGSYIFPNQMNGTLNNAGAWLTGGYDPAGNGLSFLGILRYLYNPKQPYADPTSILKQNDLSTFDAGGRMLYDSKEDKFTLGAELVYRSILNNNVVKPSFRYTLSTDYMVGKNQILSFVLGRDFNGTITKNANLIAALNLILGFGNSKSVK